MKQPFSLATISTNTMRDLRPERVLFQYANIYMYNIYI